MVIDFTVHSVSVVPLTATVEYNGKQVKATVDALEVELVSDKHEHGNITLRFTADELDEAKSFYVKDKKVTFIVSEADERTI